MKGQPRTVRLKTYSAETGLVYQYYFVGKRRALSEAASEFVFDVSSSPDLRYSVCIFVSDLALKAWCGSHGRELLDAEIYAAAKARLFQAFDEIEDLFGTGRQLQIEVGAFEELLGGLGVE